MYATFFLIPSFLCLLDHLGVGLSLIGWVVVWVNATSFFVGFSTGIFACCRLKLNTFQKFNSDDIDFFKYFNVLGILFFISFSVALFDFFRVIFLIGSVDIFSLAREYEKMFLAFTPLNYLYFISILIPALSVIGFTFDKSRSSKYKYFMYLSFVACLLCGNKVNFIIAMLICAFTYSLVVKEIKYKVLLVFLLGLISIFVTVSFLRQGEELFLNNYSELIYIIFEKIAFYIVWNYKNLENIFILNVIGDFDFPFLGFLSRVYSILSGNYEGVAPMNADDNGAFYLENSSYNLITYAGSIYISYGGILGLIFINWILGISSFWFYRRYIRLNDFYSLMLLTICMTIIALFFSAFELFRPQFIYFTMLLYFISKLINKRTCG